MWAILGNIGLGLLNFANGSSFKSLAEGDRVEIVQALGGG